MANPESKRLAVDVIARVDKLEKNMAKAANATRTQTGKMERSVKTMRQRIDSDLGRIGKGAMTGLVRGFVGPVAAALSFGAAIRGAQDAMTSFDRIAKQAKSAGLDPEIFQEYAYAAELAGVSTDQFSSALDAFNRNAGRAAAGKGELVENLRVLNPALLENIQLARTQEERFRLVADAIQEETDASRRAALAAAAFGDAGTRMVEMLRDGSRGLDDVAQKARDLGIVIDGDLLARAEDLNDEFSTATKVLDLQFKEALINLAPFLVSTAQGIGDVVGWIKEATGAAQEFYNYISGANDPGAGFGGNQAWSELLTPEQMNAMRLRLQLGNKPGENLYEGFNFGDDGNMVLAPPPPAPTLPETGGGGGGGSSRNDAASEAVKQAEAVAKLVEGLQFEQEQLSRNSQEQELYNLLKQAGVERESEYGQAIENALGPLQEQRAAIEANAAAMEEFGDIAQTAMRSFIDDLIAGKDAGEAFANVLGNIGSRLLDIGLSTLTNALMPGAGHMGCTFKFKEAA